MLTFSFVLSLIIISSLSTHWFYFSRCFLPSYWISWKPFPNLECQPSLPLIDFFDSCALGGGGFHLLQPIWKCAFFLDSHPLTSLPIYVRSCRQSNWTASVLLCSCNRVLVHFRLRVTRNLNFLICKVHSTLSFPSVLVFPPDLLSIFYCFPKFLSWKKVNVLFYTVNEPQSIALVRCVLCVSSG